MPFAYWCVLIAGVMPVFVVAMSKWGTALDNNNPRDWAGSLVGKRRRAYAAHQNCYEAFPFFAAAVLVAGQIGGNTALLNALAALFIAMRIAYVAAYISNRATLRSVAWSLGWFVTIAIFVTPVL